MNKKKILIDSVYINSGGGKLILDEIIKFILKKKFIDKFFFLFDNRLNKENKIDKTHCAYINSSERERMKFYKKNKKNYNKIVCLANVPPPIKLKSIIFIYFHNDLLIKPFDNILSFRIKLKNFFKRLYIINRLQKNYNWFVQTSFMKEKFSRSYGIPMSKINVFPIYNNFKSSKIKKNKNNSFVYVSNYSEHKNHYRLFKAFLNIASNTNENITLYLTIPEKEFFNSIYNKLSSPNNLRIINQGILNEEELKKIYKKVEFLIFPSLKESFGLPLVESINFGCKVLAPNLEYVNQVIIASIYFNPLSVDSISKAILKVIKNKDLKDSKIIVENKIDTFVDYIVNYV